MSARYQVLQHEKKPYWLTNCPLLMVTHALTKDTSNNTIFLQCKFQNLNDKKIKAFNIHIECFDVTGQPLTAVDSFSYLDISIAPDKTFGDQTPVPLPNRETRAFHIIPRKIVFDDHSIWENADNQPFVLAEYEQKRISSLDKLADQYKRDLHDICSKSNAHTYLPAQKDGFTICGCGKIILDTAKSCPACGVSINRLFALNNEELLALANEFYEQNQREQAEQKEKQAAIEQSQVQLQEKQRKKQLYTRVGLIAGILLLIAIVLLASTVHSRKLHEQEILQKTQAAVDQITLFGTDSVKVSSTIDDDTVTFTISLSDITANSMPQTLSQMTRHDLISIRNYTLQLDNAIDSWEGLKKNLVTAQNILLSKYSELGGSDSYSVQTIINSNDGVKIFEFDGNTLTYDYWEEMEGYRYNKTQLLSDINEILD